MKFSRLLLPTVLIIAFAACNGNKYQTKPQITIESINSPIPVGGSMQAKLKFTQKDGKMGQGIFIAIRVRQNQHPLPPGTGSPDTLASTIPDFPDKNEGEFQYTLDYTYLHQSDEENDTIIFKFAVIDRDNNKSDTISSPKIVIETP
jgi:uncharacterized protein YwbE